MKHIQRMRCVGSISAVCLFFSLFFTIAGRAQGGHPAANVFTAQEKDDFFTLQKMAGRRNSVVLNLADGLQYRYVVNSLKRAGVTEENSPQLYKSLAEAHQQRQPGPPLPESALYNDPTGVVPLNLFDQLYLSNTGNRMYQGSVFSSYPNGTVMTRIMMNLACVTTQGDTVVFADTAASAQWTQGERFRVFLSGNLPANVAPDSNVLGHALVLVSGAGNNGKSGAARAGAAGIEAHFISAEDLFSAETGCMTAPNYILNQGAPAACPPDTAPCVNNGSVVNPIQVCYQRNDGSCNYGYSTVGPYPSNLIFPFSGYVVFPKLVHTPISANSIGLDMELVLGGGCKMDTTAGGLPITSVFSASGDTLKWCFLPVSFAKGNCVANTPMVYVNMAMQVYVELENGQYGSCLLTSDSAAYHGQPGVYKIPGLRIFQGCLAGGTRVRLADGKERQIHLFKGNGTEEVLSGSGKRGGAAQHRKVIGTTTGTEYKPLVFIRGASGDTLLVTSRHPMFTTRGVEIADKLKKGDTLLTLQGRTVLTEVSRKLYADTVWNLQTGTGEEAAAESATYYANNFLVGDVQMQQLDWSKEINRAHSDAEIQGRIPPEWRQDYLNYAHRKQGK